MNLEVQFKKVIMNVLISVDSSVAWCMQKMLSSLIVSVILCSERNIPQRKPLGENTALSFYETNVAWTKLIKLTFHRVV